MMCKPVGHFETQASRRLGEAETWRLGFGVEHTAVSLVRVSRLRFRVLIISLVANV